MWKNIWLVLILGGLAYAYHTGWNPLAGGAPVPTLPPSIQAAGPAMVREIERMPQVIQDMSHISGQSAGSMQAARDTTQRAVAGHK